MSKYKINPHQHLKHSWQVHALCEDFELEDVWLVPVELGPKHNLQMFMDQFKKKDICYLLDLSGFGLSTLP